MSDLDAVIGTGGVVWSAAPEGVHVNLVAMEPTEAIGAHVNDAVDVLVVVLVGSGTLTVDDRPFDLRAQRAVLVPKGTRRSLTAAGDGIRYLSIHAERAPLGIGGASHV